MGLSQTTSQPRVSFLKQSHTKSDLLSNNRLNAISSSSRFHNTTACTRGAALALTSGFTQSTTEFAAPRSLRKPLNDCFPQHSPLPALLFFQVPGFILLQIKTYVRAAQLLCNPDHPTSIYITCKLQEQRFVSL